MTRIPDLSVPKYIWDAERITFGIDTLAIGWLGKKSMFEKGVTSDEFRIKLLEYCKDDNVILICLGHHICEFCVVTTEPWYSLSVERYGQNTSLLGQGNGEIRIPGKNVNYAAPSMIYHYVVEHNYKPPDEFIEAVIIGPEPTRIEYKEYLRRVRICHGEVQEW